LLQQKGIQCAILTRGYKTHTQTQATRIDEPAILAKSCPQAKVVVNPDRVDGAAEAISKYGAKVLVMDDGFQHRRLGRNLDIVTIDGTRPFGYDRMLPAGLLREPLACLKRADAVVVTRCEKISEIELSRLEEKIQQVNPDMIIARSLHKPICVKSTNDKEIGLEELKNKKIFAFCGIGNPRAFFKTIEKLGTDLADSKVYNDHHHYTQRDIDEICKQAGASGSDLILTTQKDWTKIAPLDSLKKDIHFAYLEIELKFTAGEDKLKELIEETMAGKILKNQKS
jgi:tetraacyldisaccharide 4'-kinase